MVPSVDAAAITRVLVVDDSVVVRRLVSAAVEKDPRLRVAGTAANGRIALAKIPHVNPDVVTLDVEMPELDGLATLAGIRASYPKMGVIMFSSLTERGASATVEALLRGADDYVTKPSGSKDPDAAVEQIHQALVPRILALRPRPPTAARAGSTRTPRSPRSRAVAPVQRPRAPVSIVVIAVSTGGPNALGKLVPALPANLGVPVVAVQHMPAMFTRLLAERLDQQGPLEVREGQPGAPVRPGQMWIAPGGRHMAVERRNGVPQVVLLDSPPENSCRPAADVLLRSAADVYGSGVLAVVLTGMGQDGLRGCEQVKGAGGCVIAQDRASSVVWGMPGAVTEAGLTDAVLPLDAIAGEIRSRVHSSRAGSKAAPRGLTGIR